MFVYLRCGQVGVREGGVLRYKPFRCQSSSPHRVGGVGMGSCSRVCVVSASVYLCVYVPPSLGTTDSQSDGLKFRT